MSEPSQVGPFLSGDMPAPPEGQRVVPVLPAGILEAPSRDQVRSFPKVTEPMMAPPTLEALLTSLAQARQEGDYQTLADCTRDALGFSVRYFAGLFMEASRQLDCLPGQLAEVSGTKNVDESARQLLLCLENLQRCPERLARKLIQIFVEEGGDQRLFVEHLSPGDGQFSIVSFCRASREELPTPEDLTKALRWLDQWMNATFGFFLESEQRFESGAFFGQVEQVVIIDQYSLPTGLTIRLKEMRQPSPDTTSLVLSTDSLSPITSLVLETDQLADPPSESPAPAAEPEVSPGEPPPAVEAVATEPDKSAGEGLTFAEADQLVDFLQLKLHQNTVKPRGENKARAPQGWLNCEIDQIGLQKNSQGKFGYAGYLWVELRGEGEVEIEGTATCDNFHVEVSGATFRGIQNRILYWVDPDELRTPRGHILIRAHNQTKQIPVWKLLPESAFSTISATQILALLFGPAMAGCLYTCWIFWSTSTRIENGLHNLLQGEFARFFNSQSPLSLREAGVGYLDLRLMPQIEASLLLFFCLAWMAPIASSLVYSRIPRHEKKSFALAYALALVLPSLFYLAVWPSGLVHGQVFRHPDFRVLDFRQHLTGFCLLNLSSAFFGQLWSEGFFHRHFNALGRVALATLGGSTLIATTLFLVFGRSWLGWN